jgi:hemerythrin-like domain-containing protein
MTNDPIQILLDEHKIIMEQIADLRKAVKALEMSGEEVLAETLPILTRVGEMMATKLDLHRRKEDDVLFPAVEEIIGKDDTPTVVMRQEHKDIHAQGKLLRETLRELHEEQHPAIEAGRERLQSLVADGTNAEALRQTGETIIQLLDSHFKKEEEVLFPMVPDLLDKHTLAEIAAWFTQLESAE